MSNRKRSPTDEMLADLGYPTTEPILTPLADMAQQLGVPPKWLRGEADAGRVPCLIAEGAYLFDADAVVKCVRERAGKVTR